MTVQPSVLDVLDHLGGASSDVVWIRTAGEMLYISPAYEAIWGRARESLYEAPDGFLDMVHPDDRDRLAEAFAACIQGEGDFDAEYRIVRDDGDLRIIHARTRIETDSEGNLLREVGLASEVTAQRREQAALREARRLESLGMLAGSIAHDFVNVLASISINIEPMAQDPSVCGAQMKRLEMVGEAVQQAMALCKQLLDYAGDDRQAKSRTDLGVDIRAMADLLASALPDGAELDLTDVATGVHAVVDPSQISQLMLNLVTNASEALSKSGGNVRVSLELREFGLAELRVPSFGHQLEPDEYVCIRVVDDGSGLDPDRVSRLFEPFVGSKGERRGLGLSTVLRIVREHGGAVRVDGRIGEGATFEVLLPVDGTQVDANPVMANTLEWEEASRPAPGSPALLVIEDPAERTLVAVVLEREGYHARSAATGREGRILAETEGFELAVIDADLHDGEGLTLLGEVRDHQPGIGVILLADNESYSAAQTASSDSDSILIRRPFMATELLRAVANLRSSATSHQPR